MRNRQRVVYICVGERRWSAVCVDSGGRGECAWWCVLGEGDGWWVLVMIVARMI